jgi:hypothetical protein
MSYQFSCPTGIPRSNGYWLSGWDYVYTPTHPKGLPSKLMDSQMLQELQWAAKVGLDRGLARAYKDFSELFITASNLRK